MRLFFALPLDDKTKLNIEHWSQRSFPPFNSTVPPANYHITLAFLGELPENRLEDLCEKVDSLFVVEDPLFQGENLKINQTGYWPKQGILWIGPDNWPASLDKLAGKLNHICSRFGAKKDKRAYQPHVTVVRNCQSPLQPVMEPDFSLHFDRITLFETLPTKSGVRYHPVQEWPLSARHTISGKPLVRERSRRLTTRN